MTLKLEIPKDVVAGLLAEAHAHGLSPEVYAAQLLRERIRPATEQAQRPLGRKSLAQLFAESPLKGLSLKFDRDPDIGRSVDL
jgi:hypothetical protein